MLVYVIWRLSQISIQSCYAWCSVIAAVTTYYIIIYQLSCYRLNGVALKRYEIYGRLSNVSWILIHEKKSAHWFTADRNGSK